MRWGDREPRANCQDRNYESEDSPEEVQSNAEPSLCESVSGHAALRQEGSANLIRDGHPVRPEDKGNINTEWWTIRKSAYLFSMSTRSLFSL